MLVYHATIDHHLPLHILLVLRLAMFPNGRLISIKNNNSQLRGLWQCSSPTDHNDACSWLYLQLSVHQVWSKVGNDPYRNVKV